MIGLLLLGAGLAVLLLAIGVGILLARHRERRHGDLVALDEPGGRPSHPLNSPRWRLVGRPDEIRRRPDGTLLPVEWKRRRAPVEGPFESHRVQVWGYALLLEESTGRPPPYGVLRYGDGKEFRVPWDSQARGELLGVLEAVNRPYSGEARPSPGRCAHCRWRTGCDRSMAGGLSRAGGRR
jgi:CRISPR-associated exonuclease Cas4